MRSGSAWRGAQVLRSAAVAVLATLVLTIGGPAARAQVAAVPAVGFTADSDVQAAALGPGNVLYLSGSFSSLAMRTGHWVRFDASGARDAAWPEVDGTVRVAVPDGAGGWFIGGAFTHVAGEPRAGLAHVGPGGELDPIWSPDVDRDGWDPGFGGVVALSVVGDTVYVGGSFEDIDGQPRSDLAAVDAVSGRLRAWAPRVEWDVSALAAAAGKLYVAGEFTQVGSAPRGHLAAFDAATGTLDAWNPDATGFDFPGAPVTVTSLLVDRGTLYAGGQFDAIAGRARPGVAAFDVATGALSAWNPQEIDRQMNSVLGMLVADDTVYVSVSFGFDGEGCKRLGGPQDSVWLVAIDATTRAAVRWCAGIRPVFALAAVGDRVYVGGGWPNSGQRFLRVVSAATGVLNGWDPQPNGPVSSLVATGDGVLAGGFFSGLDRTRRHGGAAIDLDTGALLPFELDHTEVFPADGIDAVATVGSSVFAAGDFDRIGGRHRLSLAKLDATTGRARRWDAHVGSGGRPHALTVWDQRLYVGGDFRRIGGRARRGLAALDTRTGRATSWRADTNGRVQALTIRGHTLYVAGDFTRVGGRRRRHLAAIDLRTGRVTAWHPNPDGPVRALAVAGRTVYLSVDAGRRRGRLAAVDAANGARQRWRAAANARVHALAVIDGTLYAGGDFTSIAGAPRERIAALDARDGTLSAWHPGANDRVTALLATPAGLVAVGPFTSLGGTGQSGLGIFPTP